MASTDAIDFQNSGASRLFHLLRRPSHGLRRRKNCARFVAGIVTDLLVPSLTMLAVLVIQLTGAESVSTCSKVKPPEKSVGQETITYVSERSTESAGRGRR